MALTASGDVLSTSARWKRLGASIPSSYTVFYNPNDSKYYAECQTISGTNITANADAATVIQAANDALTGGGVIFIRAGTYPLSSILYPWSNIWLVGEGSSTLFTSSQVVGMSMSAKSNVRLSNFKLTMSTGATYGILAQNTSSDIFCENLELTTSNAITYGIMLSGTSNSTVMNSKINGFANGIGNYYVSNYNKVIGNLIQNTTQRGLCVLKGAGLLISDNRFIDACNGTYAVISMGTTHGDLTDSVIDDNTIIFTANPSATDVDGIVLSGENTSGYEMKNITVTGNTLNGGEYANTIAGIYLHGQASGTKSVKNISIVGNSIRGFDQGICNTYSQHITESGNSIARMQKYGIQIAASSNCNLTGNTISEHNLAAGGHPAIYFSGTVSEIIGDGTAKSPIPADLSGAAATHYLLHPEQTAVLLNAHLVYTEASSADAGIILKIGKESDDDYYYTGTSEISKAQWYTKTVTLLARDVTAGDTVTFTSAGGKTGTGEILCILDYCLID